MSRPRILATAAVLILFTGAAWIFWPPREEPAPSGPAAVIKSVRRMADPPSQNPRLPSADDDSSPSPFTFEHDGKKITVNLAITRQSLRRMHRPAPANPAAAELHPQQPWPGTAFLSWPSRQCMGTETVKTIKCWVIDFKHPAARSPNDPFSLVRAFVRQEDGVLVRMNGYDWAGKRTMDYTVTTGKKEGGILQPLKAVARYYEPGSRKSLLEVNYVTKP